MRLLVRSVAERTVLGVFAVAQPVVAGFLDLEAIRPVECGTDYSSGHFGRSSHRNALLQLDLVVHVLVNAIADRIRLGFAAQTPRVGLVCGHENNQTNISFGPFRGHMPSANSPASKCILKGFLSTIAPFSGCW